MKKQGSYIRDVLLLLLGEVILSLLTALVYTALKEFSYKTVLGLALGTAVTVANYIFLIISVNRGIDRFMAQRGHGEMTDEEADAFAAKHAAEVQNASKLSYILRTFTMLGALILAFISNQFDVIATVIPILAFQPILILESLIFKKKGE